MTEQLTDTEQAYELSRAEHKLADFIEPGKTYQQLYEACETVTVSGTEIYTALVWLQYAADSKNRGVVAEAGVTDVKAVSSHITGFAKRVKPNASLDAMGARGTSTFIAAIEADNYCHQQASVTLANMLEALGDEGFIAEEDHLPLEISQESAVNEVLHDAYILFDELARSGEIVDPKSGFLNLRETIGGVFGLINDAINRGSFRVFMTHGRKSSRYSYPGNLNAGARVIELQAEAADYMSKEIQSHCAAAGLDIEAIAERTGIPWPEIGLRYVLMHEFGHALHMAPNATEGVQQSFMIEHPQEAVSANFTDSLAAERERFAEGLASYYLEGLLIRAGFDDRRALDTIISGTQRSWIIPRQELYAESKDNPVTLGINVTYNSMQAAQLGYGLPLDGAELLERLTYVGQNLAIDNNFGIRTAEKHDVLDVIDDNYFNNGSWQRYLEKNGVELDRVHHAVEGAVNDAAKIAEAGARREKFYERVITGSRVGTLIGVGMIAGLLAERLIGEQDNSAVINKEATVIEAVDGHHYAVDEVYPDGSVLFELQEPATEASIDAGLSALGETNFVLGTTEDGRTLFMGRSVESLSVEPLKQGEGLSSANEIYQRLPEELKAKVSKSNKLMQGGFSEIVQKNANLSNDEDSLIFSYDVDQIIKDTQRALN